jgi:AcrR family transcriptional regulator
VDALRPEPRSPVNAEQVLDHAAELFLANGYYGTRMQDIAEFFGVTHAALYYHFRNKQDILARINLRALEQLLESAHDAMAEGRPPRETLLEMLRRHMTHVAHGPAVVAALLEHDLEIPPESFAEIARRRREYNDLFVVVYDRGKHEGTLPDVDSRVAVSLLIGACNWIYRWYEPGGALPPAQLVEQGMQLLGMMTNPSRG